MDDKGLEILRKKAYGQYKKAMFLCGCFILASLMMFGRHGIHNEDYTLFEWGLFTLIITALLTVIFCCLCYLLLIRRAQEGFIRAYKEQYVLPLLMENGRFQTLEYFPESGPGYDEVAGLHVVDCGVKNHFSSTDLLTGYYGDIRFLLCNVNTGRTGKVGKIYTSDSIFHGPVIRFDNVPALLGFQGTMRVFDNKYVAGFKDRPSAYKIKTGDPGFDGRFQVYASDGDDTPLTPVLIEKMKAFADKSGKWVSFTFSGSSAIVAVHRPRNLFDVFVDKPVSGQKAELLKDIRMIQAAGELFT